jgi:hypothetical protein
MVIKVLDFALTASYSVYSDRSSPKQLHVCHNGDITIILVHYGTGTIQ